MRLAISGRAGGWPLVAATAGIAAAIALGQWQLGRAEVKREARARYEARAAQTAVTVTAAEMDAEATDLRRVVAHGTFEPRHAVFIDNRIHRGVAGYHVVMPLRIAGSDRFVLVNRGWVPRTPERPRLPVVSTPTQLVTIEGIAAIPRQRTLELSPNVIEGAIWQNLTIERYRAALPIVIQPFLIQQTSAAEDGLVRDWPAPDFGIDKHYGYAFQWFALAATIFLFYAITRFRSKTRPRS